MPFIFAASFLSPSSVVLAIVVILILVILVKNIRVVPQAKAFIIERLGAYSTTWNVGLHLKVPFIERVHRAQQTLEFVFDVFI